MDTGNYMANQMSDQTEYSEAQYEHELSEGVRKVSKEWPLSKFKTFVSTFLQTENNEDQWTFDYESFALSAYRSKKEWEPKFWAPEYYQERWDNELFECVGRAILNKFIPPNSTEDSSENAVLAIHNVSVSFSADGMEKVDKYHKQTLNKVNNLYKYLYDRTVCATELADQQEEVFAYLRLTDDIKEAYRKFRDSVCGLANER